MRRLFVLAGLLSVLILAIGTDTRPTEAAPLVHCNQVHLHPGALPNGQVGLAYSTTLWLTPANPVLQAFVTNSPSVPSGLSFASGPNVNQVTLLGVPTTSGTYTFTVDVGATYRYGTICTKSMTYTVTIAP